MVIIGRMYSVRNSKQPVKTLRKMPVGIAKTLQAVMQQIAREPPAYQ
jgi:hypothetical protein